MKPMQVVIAIVRDPITGHLLFQERKRQPYKGYFGLVGGKVESSEQHEDAIVREVDEETGLKVLSHKYVQVIHETMVSNGKSSEVALHIYLAEVSGDIKANLTEGKIHWKDESHFNTCKRLYIPTDWLIVNAVINGGKLFNRILIEDNGTQYEIKAIS